MPSGAESGLPDRVHSHNDGAGKPWDERAEAAFDSPAYLQILPKFKILVRKRQIMPSACLAHYLVENLASRKILC